MDKEKITVSLDDVNSSRIDAEIHRQDVASRMAEHQEKIRVDFGGSGEMLGAKGGFFRKAIVYMAIFGLVFSIMGWGVGEIFFKELDKPNTFVQATKLLSFLVEKYPDISRREARNAFQRIKTENKELQNNEFLPNRIVDMTKAERTAEWEKVAAHKKRWNCIWLISLSIFISFGLSIAEACISKNLTLAIKNGIYAILLGGLGGYILSLFINEIYKALQGEAHGFCFQQIFARSIGWGLLGAFLAIAPGIVMKSPKKIFLGLAGGAIGGLIGGMLFDPICKYTQSVISARFVNIVGLGVGAAIATVLLENVAKQGWLKVTAGLIAGKQFILYRNPTVIGSSPKCEIYLFKDPQVSPKHAAINNRNGDFILTAIESAPVYVNGTAIKQQKLNNGDHVKVGNTLFRFEAKELIKK